MATGGTFRVAADATATASGVSAAWTASGRITLDSQDPGVAAPSFGFGPSAATTFYRSATATLTCTGTGTATATATLSGATSNTAQVAVSCLDAVTVTGLADQTHTGAGAHTFTDAFTVAPATAACTTTSGTVAAGAGGARTVSVALTAPAARDVTVTCAAADRADASKTVKLTAVEPCSDHIGALAPGVTVRSGTITADSSCTSTRPSHQHRVEDLLRAAAHVQARSGDVGHRRAR